MSDAKLAPFRTERRNASGSPLNASRAVHSRALLSAFRSVFLYGKHAAPGRRSPPSMSIKMRANPCERLQARTRIPAPSPCVWTKPGDSIPDRSPPIAIVAPLRTLVWVSWAGSTRRMQPHRHKRLQCWLQSCYLQRRGFRLRRSQMLLLHNPKVRGQPGEPASEAIAIEHGRIVAVGPASDVRALTGERSQELDIGGAHVHPGLIDGHAHVVRAGLTWDRKMPLVRG